MKKKRIIAIHGNPGSPKDFHLVRENAKVFDDKDWVSFDYSGLSDTSEIFSALDQLVTEGDVAFFAYSYGAYLALLYCESRSLDADLILVNPYLITEDKVSNFGKKLAANKFVLKPILSLIKSKQAKSFMAKTFSPARPSQFNTGSLEKRLENSDVWHMGLRRKIAQQEHPLRGRLPKIKSLKVLIGDQDTVAPWQRQLAVLETLGLASALEKKVFKGAGHALLWTHPSQLAATI